VTCTSETTVGLDSVTRRNLELTRTLRDRKVQGSLLGVPDRTVTPMGARLLRRWIQQPPPVLLKEGGLIRSGYHAELDQLRQAAAEGRDWLAAYEAQERERTGISTLRVRYNQNTWRDKRTIRCETGAGITAGAR